MKNFIKRVLMKVKEVIRIFIIRYTSFGSKNKEEKISLDNTILEYCTHHDRDGNTTIINKEGNECICKICGSSFTIVDYSELHFLKDKEKILSESGNYSPQDLSSMFKDCSTAIDRHGNII